MSLSIATQGNQSSTIPAILVATLINKTLGKDAIIVKFEDLETLKDDKTATTKLVLGAGPPIYGDLQIVKEIVEAYPNALAGAQQKQGKEWIERAQTLSSPDFKSIEGLLSELDSHLTLRAYIVGYTLTVTDIIVWGVLRGNRAAHAYIKKGHLTNLSRWFRFIEEANPWIPRAVETLSLQIREKKTAKSKEGASYDIALLDTENGVVTRFPPEPSGYLHIGHAKAALLNDYFAHEKYKGTLLLRFDDTNPSKEKEEFQDAIIEDLALMGIKPDRTSYSSDYFDDLYKYCIQMIKDGNAYADDTDQATMRDERMKGIASKCRDRTVDENLAVFEEMKKGSELGIKSCIRAKISVDNPNKALRDPVIYRCNPVPHHRLGSKWNIYPTYDFCCPVLDSIENVTHALRTNEYRDRNPQYQWILEALKLRRVHIWDFARMNFIRTLLSKRKLTKFVEQGVVWGWDDPRFPTIRGIRRRGMTVGALREFILKQGPSRNIVNLDWTLIWATNKKYIDPIAPRYTAVLKENAVTATVKGAPAKAYTEDRPRHAKNAELGTKKVAYSGTILIDLEDAKTFKEGEEITLMAWGNAIVRKFSTSASPIGNIVTNLELELHLQGDVKKTEKKITWLSPEGQTLVPVELVDFDHLITKDKIEEDDNVEDFLNPKTEFRSDAWADENVADLKLGDIIQFERKGYFRLDRPFTKGVPAVFFSIPTGKTGK
ncbi:hypothetical protein GP486_005049 [Trichoglossum hirsutum]|uniref:glutamate--tRNA ligase n=1 Tax=Trichoglossum hirsutum TaxID=265104 RepID=A0A9P8LA04_9PEZI|nr:hypothetical protein GP486_005049 [Trichoglossum hirsutum]